MYPYNPKPIHAAALAFLCILFLALCGYTRNERVLFAFKVGAVIFAILAAIISFMLVMDSMNERVRVMTDWMEAFAKLPDDEARAAVAFAFPFMRYKMKRGIVREMFQDTNVPIETFKTFLLTSTDQQVSPLREWYTKERPEWAWREIMDYLIAHDYVHEGSASGSHSWLWVGNSYAHLCAYWKPFNGMVNMNQPLPHRENASEEA